MNTEETTGTSASEVETKTAPAKKVAKKKVAKKAVKKVAPKKAAKKAAKKSAERKEYTLKEPQVIKATSVAEAVKLFKQSKLKRAVLSVNGKKYAATLRSSWAISKNLLATGADGLIMVIDGEGYYVYPKAKFTEAFGKFMKSNTWKEKGVYSMSGLPQWHDEFFTAK
jgi:hypothetical protein